MTTKKGKGNSVKQIPFGNDNKKSKGLCADISVALV